MVNYRDIGIGIILIVAVMFIIRPGALVGGTVLSIDDINYISNDPDIQGPAIATEFSADGAGQSLSGSVTSRDILDFTGREVTNEFTVEVITDDITCRFPLNPDQTPVYPTLYQSSGCEGYPDGLVSTTPTEFTPGVGSGQTCYSGISTAGNVYRFDPSSGNSARINVTYTRSDGQSYTVQLDESQLSAVIPNIIKVRYLGNIVGSLNCPDVDDNLVFFVPRTNPGAAQLKDFNAFDAVNDHWIGVTGSLAETLSSSQQLYSAGRMGIVYSNVQQHNSFYSSFINSVPSTGQYCVLRSDSGQVLEDAYAECEPVTPTIIPQLLITTPADTVSAVVPVGQPDILDCRVASVEAADLSIVECDVKNTANVEGSFDLRIESSCGVFSTREFIEAGATETISVRYECAGAIQNTQITVNDVNNPANTDSFDVRLNIAPFCSTAAPTPAHAKENSEYGCEWTCPNRYNTDIFEDTCQSITNYDREGIDISGSHCIGIGQYMRLNDYMDGVFEGTIQSFIPPLKPNLVWLPSPICNYVGEFGYRNVDGQAVPILEDYRFDYSLVGQEPQGELITPTSEGTLPSGISQSLPPSAIPTMPTIPMGSAITQFITNNFLWIVFGLGAVVVYFTFIRKGK